MSNFARILERNGMVESPLESSNSNCIIFASDVDQSETATTKSWKPFANFYLPLGP